MDKKEIVWSARAKNDLGKIWDHVAEKIPVQKAVDITHGIYIQVSKPAIFHITNRALANLIFQFGISSLANILAPLSPVRFPDIYKIF